MWGCRSERPALALLPNQRPAWGSFMQAFCACARSALCAIGAPSAHAACPTDCALRSMAKPVSGSRPEQQSPSATQNLDRTDAYARTAGPIASHPLSDHLPGGVDVQFDDGLNTMKLPTQRFEAVHFTEDSAINSQENLNNGLGPDSLHCVQGGRVWHRHVLRHQVALRPREEGERRSQQIAVVGRTYAGRVEVGG